MPKGTRSGDNEFVQFRSSFPRFELIYSRHALERMAERGIAQDDIRHVLAKGRVVRSEPHIRGGLAHTVEGRDLDDEPLAVVVAIKSTTRGVVLVVTTFLP